MKTSVFSDATLANQCDLVERKFITDPVAGSAWMLTYEGTAYGVEIVGASLLSFGAKIEVTEDGGKCKLVATFAKDPDTASNPAAEVPVDRYDLDWELVQASVFSIPAATIEAKGYISAAQYKKDITDLASNGSAYTLDATQYPAGKVIYQLLTRGDEHYEFKVPVLTRVRTYTDKYPYRTVIQQRETVYVTSSLISAFGIPSSIQAILPVDPTGTDTPADCIWSWKLRGERLTYNSGTRRYEESLTWAFRAWSNQLYNVA
jgi:hypothetical protein